MDYFETCKVTEHWFAKLLRIRNFDNQSRKNLLHKIVQTMSQEVIKDARYLNYNFYFNYFRGDGFEEDTFEELYQNTLPTFYNEEMEIPFPDDEIKPIDCFFGYTEISSRPSTISPYFLIGGSLDLTIGPGSTPGEQSFRKNFLQREDFNKMFRLFEDIASGSSNKMKTIHRIVDTITFLGQLDVSMLNEDGDVTLSNGQEKTIWPILERDTRVTASYYLEFLINCFIYLMNEVRNEDEIVILQECPYVFDRFISSREPNLAYRVVNFLQTNQDNSEYRINTQWMRSSEEYNSLSILFKILSMNTCVNDAYIDTNMLRFADLNVTVGNNPVLTSYTQVQKALLKIFEMNVNFKNKIDNNANVTAIEFARLQYNHINNQVQSGNGEKQPLYERIVQDYSGIVNLITYLEGDTSLKEDVGSLTQQKEMSKVLLPIMGSKFATYPQAEILTNRPGGPTIGSIKRKAQRAAERASQGDPDYPQPKSIGGKKKRSRSIKKKGYKKKQNRSKKQKGGSRDIRDILKRAKDIGAEELFKRLLYWDDINNAEELHLFQASRNNEVELVRLLLEIGADINQANSVGETPLYVASEAGHEHIVRILLENGADVNKAGYDEQTPLMMAVEMGHEEVVEILLEYGANLDAKTNEGYTVFDMVYEDVFPEMATLLKAYQQKNEVTENIKKYKRSKMPTLRLLAFNNLYTNSISEINKNKNMLLPPSKLGGKKKKTKKQKVTKNKKTRKRNVRCK